MKNKLLMAGLCIICALLPTRLSAQIPIANFALSPTLACTGSSVQVNDLSTNLPTGWSWVLGGSPATSTLQNPVVTFNTAGIYTVSLIASNIDGESALVSQTIEVVAVPELTVSGTATLCVGAVINLSVTGADSYVWSSGSATDTETFSPAGNTTYSVTGTNALTGCIATALVPVTVNPLPLLTTSGGTAVCLGTAIVQTLGGADTYTWNSDAVSGNTLSINPSVNTTYTLSGTNTLTGCQNSVTIPVTVNSLPAVSISGNSTVCAGSSLALSATGADDYLWSDGSTGANAGFTLTSNTTLSVTGTNTLTGCQNTAAVAITVIALPSLTLSGTNAYCVSGTASQTVTGADSYLWSTGTAVDTETFSPAVTSIYSVTGTNTLTGCASTLPFTITVNQLPVLSVTGSTALCLGAGATLTLSGADSFTWNGVANADNTVSISPSSNTTYTLTGLNSSTGCENTLSIPVVVNPLPVISVAGNNTVCTAAMLVLTASGGDSYLWDNGSATDATTVYPTADTDYTVTGTNTLTGCSDIAVFSVTTVALPALSLSGTDEYCAGGSATQTVSGADTYLWSTGNTSDNEAFNAMSSAVYSVTGTSTLTGCASTETVNITVNPLPALTISNDQVCSGSSLTATLSGADSYSWNAVAVSDNTLNLNPLTSDTYTLEGIISNTGCYNSTVISIAVNPLPTITVSGSGTVCAGSIVVQTATGADTYLWNDNQATDAATFSPLANTDYTVTGTNTLTGCSDQAVVSVTAVSLPTLALSGTDEYCVGGSATQTVSGADSYLWSTGTTADNELFNPLSSTVYSVTGNSTLTGCSATATLAITVNPLPVLAVSGNGSVCIGSTITPSLSGADSYTWNGSAVSGNTISLNPAVNTSYTLEGVIAATGCYNSSTVTISVNPLPVISIAGDATVCAGSPIVQTASGADSYIWNDNQTTDAATFTPLSNTVYTVTGTNTLTGCSDMATASVTAVVLPSLTLSGVNNYCEGGSATQTVSGADTYSWSTGNSTDTETFSPVASTVYSVTGTSTLTGCMATIPVSITVNIIPTLTVNSGSVCAGSVFTINPSGAFSYTYSTGNNTVIPVNNDSYTVTGVSAEGCAASNTAIASVTVNALPVVSISDATICAGTSFSIQPGGANTYMIQGGSSNVSPLISTTYTISGTSVEGCVSAATATLSLTVNALPTLTISGSASLCVGQTGTLTATGANTYTWSPNTVTNNISVSPLVNTTYTVTGTDLNGCINNTVREVTVNAVPVVTVSGGTICQGSQFVFSPTGAAGYNYSSGSASVNPLMTSNYTITGTSAEGCVSQNAVATVSVVNAVTLSVSGDLSVCMGLSTTLTASGASSYSWNTGATNAAISPTPSSNTSYTVTGFNGPCVSNSVVTVVVNALPTYSATSSASVICSGETATLIVVGPGTYTWSTLESSSSITVAPSSTTTYTVGGMDANGCVNATTITQTVDACTGIAERFSGLNAGLYPNPNNGDFSIEAGGECNVKILNALGQEVYSSTLEKGVNHIQLHDQPAGIYHVQLYLGTQTRTFKMVRN